jgi:hypothetical protein
MMAKPRARKTATVLPIDSASTRGAEIYTVTDHDVARRAFEIFCARGAQDGHDVEDWLQAERELRGSLTAVA